MPVDSPLPRAERTPWPHDGARADATAGSALDRGGSGAITQGAATRVPVVVMNPYYTGLGIARSLHGTGVAVHALTSEPGTPGARSRYFASVRVVPNGRDEPAALCAALMRMADSFAEPPILFPTRDFDVLFLHEHRATLAPAYRLPYRDCDAVVRAMDKLELSRVAAELRIPAPATVAVGSTAELAEASARLRFPVIVKPRFAYQWRHRGLWERIGGQKAFITATRAELEALYAHLAPIAPDALVQEFVPGIDHDIVVCCCVLGRDGALLGHFTGRKLRQSPPLVGTGCVVEAADVPGLIGPTLELLHGLGCTGIAEVEYKLDRATGIHHLIEVNPRHWDQHELGCLVGVNVSRLAYADLAGLPVTPATPVYAPGVRYKWLAESELLSSVAREVRDQLRLPSGAPGAGRGGRLGRAMRVLTDAVRLVRGRRVLGMWRLSDPRPGFATARWIGREGWRALRGRRGARRDAP